MIKIKECQERSIGTVKTIKFTYGEEEYVVRLYWTDTEGYELDFVSDNEPDWAIEWEAKDHDDMSLEVYLDEMTFPENLLKSGLL